MAGTLVPGEADMAHLALFAGAQHRLQRTAGGEHPVRIVHADDLVELQQIKMIGLQAPQRGFKLGGCCGGGAAVDLGHQEHAFPIAAAQRATETDLALAAVVVPAIVAERDTVIDRLVDDARRPPPPSGRPAWRGGSRPSRPARPARRSCPGHGISCRLCRSCPAVRRMAGQWRRWLQRPAGSPRRPRPTLTWSGSHDGPSRVSPPRVLLQRTQQASDGCRVTDQVLMRESVPRASGHIIPAAPSPVCCHAAGRWRRGAGPKGSRQCIWNSGNPLASSSRN